MKSFKTRSHPLHIPSTGTAIMCSTLDPCGVMLCAASYIVGRTCGRSNVIILARTTGVAYAKKIINDINSVDINFWARKTQTHTHTRLRVLTHIFWWTIVHRHIMSYTVRLNLHQQYLYMVTREIKIETRRSTRFVCSRIRLFILLFFFFISISLNAGWINTTNNCEVYFFLIFILSGFLLTPSDLYGVRRLGILLQIIERKTIRLFIQNGAQVYWIYRAHAYIFC